MVRRHQRQERREGRRGNDEGSNRYQMREKLVSIGDDFYIENGAGHRVYHVDGKAVRVRNTLNFNDMHGNTLYSIQERIARVRDTMNIEKDGHRAATVKKAMISPVRSRYSIDAPGGDMTAHGNIVDHEYKISRGDDEIAEVSKRWFRIRDTYGVEVDAGEDAALILAITTVIDQLEDVK